MLVNRSRPPLAILVLFLFVWEAHGDDKKAMPGDRAATQDYSAELTRTRLKSAAESQTQFVTRPGFHVELVAAEPLLQSPVAIDFDESGRIYVAEFPEYNQYANNKPHGVGCIRLLEDVDGNGVYDKSTVFAANVPNATAVVCWNGGVYAASAPDLLYLKDTDGDGRADVRRVVFTGFGKDLAGESIMNSFRWGLDNRFHVSTNNAGGNVTRAGRSDARTVSVRGHGFLFNPRDESFELTGGGGQHGMSMDDWGRAYVCANSDPFELIMYDSRYLARNPYLTAPAAAVNVAPAGKFTKLFRVSSVEPWRALRTRLRSQGIVPGSDEGGSPSGFFTGATGVTVYRGHAFPPEYRGNLFVGDVSNNLIHRARAVANGVLVSAPSAEIGREFVASADNFFRPVQMANGPDGCLWVIDMYRELIEGAAFLPPSILKHMDVASGVDRGRLWRIVPDGFRPDKPSLKGTSTAGLVALLGHPNGWHRDTASRLLYERQDRSAVPELKGLLATARSPLARVHALHALEGLGALMPDDVLLALADAEPRVRERALRLAERFCRDNPKIQDRMAVLVADPDPLVRYQLAFSLGALSGSKPAPPLIALARRDASDPWIAMAILSSVPDCAGDVFRGVVQDANLRSTRQGRSFIASVAAQAAANRPADLDSVLDSLEGELAADEGLSREIVAAVMSKLSIAAKTRLLGIKQGRTAIILARLLDDSRQTALDETKTPAARSPAIHLLRFSRFSNVHAILGTLLVSRQPVQVQTAAIETLATFDDPGVPAILLKAWGGTSPRVRTTVTEALLSRPAWANAFLDALEAGSVARADVDPARLELLKAYPDEPTRKRAAAILAGGLSGRHEVVAAYQEALRMKGNPERGKAVFARNCATCHRLENVGEAIGADLSAIRDRGLEAVLLNVLDPNREVMPQYVTYVLVTASGRIVTGLIAAETANSLTIRKPDGGEETVLRLEIDELKSTGQSFMPEGLERQIDLASMADLLAYLNAVR